MTFLWALLFVLIDILNQEKANSVNSTYHVSTKWLCDHCVIDHVQMPFIEKVMRFKEHQIMVNENVC